MNTKQTYRPNAEPFSHSSPTLTVNGCTFTAGQTVRVDGLRGKATFRAHVVANNGAEWVDVTHKERARSVRPDRILPVHRKSR